jgi:hypothetical protein
VPPLVLRDALRDQAAMAIFAALRLAAMKSLDLRCLNAKA